jgi:hypothetical protein
MIKTYSADSEASETFVLNSSSILGFSSQILLGGFSALTYFFALIGVPGTRFFNNIVLYG